ncbi:MAG: GIY-YIG nuclease family protein [Cyclobacteriaceae bacterium]|nr:GIY-YIG nuclease family protein [Cyclobacteriaceae bacterium]
MRFTVYVLKSEVNAKLYIGQTQNLAIRLTQEKQNLLDHSFHISLFIQKSLTAELKPCEEKNI